MNYDWKKIAIALGAIGALALAILLFFIWRNSGGSSNTQGGSLGEGAPTVAVGQSGASASSLPTFSSGSAEAPQTQPVFKIADGPVVAGILIQAGQPTTTVARYLTAADGHVLDLPLDVSGAAPRVVSNTTIPGIQQAFWTEGGRGVIVQYLSQGNIKTAHLTLAAASSTAAAGDAGGALAIRFFPDNLIGLAISPDGASVVYLTAGASTATDGYLSKSDGTGAKKLFSLPLRDVILSWPSKDALLIQSKSSSGIEGIALSVQAKTGVVSPVLYGTGLTTTANSAFSHLLYRTDDGRTTGLFLESLSTGSTTVLSMPSPLQPAFPEVCAWSIATSTRGYCAAPAGQIPSGYLDYWHSGEASSPDTLVMIDLSAPSVQGVATPGTRDGGETSDMVGLSLSADDHYLSFISKDDQVLWGVRLPRN